MLMMSNTYSDDNDSMTMSEVAANNSTPSSQMEQSPPGSSQPSVDADKSIETIIQPRRGWIAIDWKEIWKFRELLYFLTWRDIKVRYKQAVLGIAWAILQPVAQMVIFTIVLGKLAGMQERLQGDTPYTIWVLVGLLPWQLFAVGIGAAALSLVAQQNLLTKIYLPRLFVPTAPIGGALVDMAIGFLILIGVMAGYAIAGYSIFIGPGLVMLPVLLVLMLLATLGVAYLFSALTVTFRDARFILPFLSQIMMWMSFVQIPLTVLDNHPVWRAILAINPAMGIIGGFRSAILGEPWLWTELGISAASALGICILGMFYFRRTERRFADIA